MQNSTVQFPTVDIHGNESRSCHNLRYAEMTLLFSENVCFLDLGGKVNSWPENRSAYIKYPKLYIYQQEVIRLHLLQSEFFYFFLVYAP
jgi:hypothetical protein